MKASYNYNHGRLTIPSAQELTGLDVADLNAEIAEVEAAINSRYQPNGTFAEMVDRYTIVGKEEHRVFYVDLIRYRANLKMALKIKASEDANGGIGILDMTRDEGPGRGGRGCWGGGY